MQIENKCSPITDFSHIIATFAQTSYYLSMMKRLVMLLPIIMLYAGAWAAGVPAAVDELTVSVDPDGLCVVDVAFTTPGLTIDGEPLTILDAIVVMRDGSLLTSVDNPPPGRKMIYIDTDVPFGRHSYSVYAVNAAGKGAVASADCYIGVAPPVPPAGVKAVEAAGNDGVTVSWNIPAQDINGSALSSKYLLFDIYSSIDGAPFHLIASTVKGESYNVPLQRGFVGYAVIAVNDAGSSEMSEVYYTYIGDGASMPYFDNGRNGFIAYGPWRRDSDGKCYTFESVGQSRGLLMFEKVKVDSESAALSFDIFGYNGSANLNVRVISDGEIYNLETIGFPLDGDSSERISIPLHKFVGEHIVTMLEASAENPASVSIKDLRIGEPETSIIVPGVEPAISISCTTVEVSCPGRIEICRLDGVTISSGLDQLSTTLPDGLYLLITSSFCRKIAISH